MFPLSSSPRFARGAIITFISLTLCLGFFLIFSRVRASSAPFSSWRFDFSRPFVTLESLENGSTFGGTIQVNVQANDNSAISLVRFYIDGVLYGEDVLPPYSFLWSTALETNGSYTLTTKATDSYGNTATSQRVTVTVDNPPLSTKPNIVVVLTDDQRWDTMEYLPLTNALLSADSIRFNNAIAAVPLCCPSRASIFTGLYSHNHGIKDNYAPYGGAVVFRESAMDTSTLATWLDGAGYQTGLFGKYLNSYDKIAPYIPPGWDQWFAFLNDNGNYYNYSLLENGITVNYGGRPGEYATTVITEKAIQFITEADPDDPVFVYLAPFAPHSLTSAADSPPIPGPGDEGIFASLAPWRPTTYNEADVSDKPLWVRNLELLTPEKMERGDQFRIKQLESLLAVDRAVEDLIEALIQTGRYENTIFVFLSDNGLSWGEHRWNVKKWCAYEECIRIPFWIKVPGVAGRDDDSLVNDVDLGPTLAELAGVRIPSRLDGRSMVDLIEDPGAPWRTEAYTEYISPVAGGKNMMFRAVRTATHFYAEYENGDREFYDLSIDPLQEINRVNDPEYAGAVRDLERALKVLRGH